MALTKFLKSVSWTDPSEVKQAVEVLLPMWTDVEMVDALELLGPGFVDGRVRAYAVKQLGRADDDVSALESFPLPVFRGDDLVKLQGEPSNSSLTLVLA